MKFFNKNMILWTAVALLAIIVYQAYWLGGLYRTMNAKLEADIQEAIRAADFAEMVCRIDYLRNSDDNEIRQMNITVGADPHDNNAYMLSETEKKQDTTKTVQTMIPGDNLSEVMRRPEDVMELGLYFQRGIHAGLDKEIGVNVNCFDSLLTARLDSLGIRSPHLTLFMRIDDTLATVGNPDLTYHKTYIFDLDITEHTQYQVLLPKIRSTVFAQMSGILSVSFITLLILSLTFWNLINTIKKQHALDEMDTGLKKEAKTSASDKKTMQIGRYEFNPVTQTLTLDGETAELSNRASEILRMLAEKANQVVTSDEILLDLWGDNNIYTAGSLQVFITKLRHALSQDNNVKIVNVRGKGYKMIIVE